MPLPMSTKKDFSDVDLPLFVSVAKWLRKHGKVSYVPIDRISKIHAYAHVAPSDHICLCALSSGCASEAFRAAKARVPVRGCGVFLL